MVMQPWIPFRELRRMDETMNRLWRGFGRFNPEIEGAEGWTLPLDVIEQDDRVLVKASVPGVKPDELDISIEDNVLTIKGETSTSEDIVEEHYRLRERRFGSFHRTLRLPESVNSDGADTHYEHGVLTVSLPKAEAKKARRLSINTHSQN